MAIAFDAFSRAPEASGNLSWTHTPVGTPKGVVVQVSCPEGTDHVTTVTYGGSSLSEVSGSPNLKVGGEAHSIHTFFLGDTIPIGAQTVAVTVDGSAVERLAACYTMTASDDTEVQNVDHTINSSAVANPSGTLTLNGEVCFCILTWGSGHNATADVSHPVGWTRRRERDHGTSISGTKSYDTIGSGDVTFGWTQTTEDATATAIAVTEVTSLTHYTLTTEEGVFIESGIAIDLDRTYVISAAESVFVLSGIAAGVLHHRIRSADVGTFIFTGVDAILIVDRELGATIAAGQGIHILTGIAATILADRKLTTATASFTIVGQAMLYVETGEGLVKTTHRKVVTLLRTKSPAPWNAVYMTHDKADLVVPSISVEADTDVPLVTDGAIVQQELVDNRNVRLTIRAHVAYRLGPANTDLSVDLADVILRWLRENINLSGGYRIFEVSGIAYNVEHVSSGTTGSELTVDIHKVEYYVQN